MWYFEEANLLEKGSEVEILLPTLYRELVANIFKRTPPFYCNIDQKLTFS